MQVHLARFIGARHFAQVSEQRALALGVDALARHVIQAQHDILRRHDDGVAVGGRQDVIRRQHQRACFYLCFDRQGHVHRHLIAVEVGVERRTHQRMQLDRLAFDQHRFERLNTQAVQGRGAVQHHRMLANHVFQNIPHLGGFLLHRALGGFNRRGQTQHFQFVENKRLEQLQRHFFGQTTLVQFQLRADHDDRTAGIVDAFAQQVLTEAAALALNHVSQRFQRALVGAGHGFAAAAVVEQGIHGFLQHALFIAHDDFRRLQFQQSLQAVVAVDHAAVQIVQIGSREAAAIQRHQRTQFRRQHRQHFQNHPIRTYAGTLERFQHF